MTQEKEETTWKRNPPLCLQKQGKLPIQITIGFIVHDILNVDDHSNIIKLKISIPLSWNDNRITLSSDHTMNKVQHGSGEWRTLDSKYLDILWFPRLLISNLKDFRTLSSFDVAEKIMISPVSSGMRFYYEGNHLISFICPMMFDDFPFDTHNCLFEVYLEVSRNEQTFSHFGSNSSFWGWSNASSMLQYSTNFFPIPIDQTHRVKKYSYNSGIEQSKAGFRIKFVRKAEVYIFDYYIPSGIFVLVSWVSLAIPPDAPPGRIALIITTFLVLVNIANSIFSKSPRSHSINPMQVWILSCIIFVFLTVLEYALVLFLIRKQKKFVLDNKKKKQGAKVANGEPAPAEAKPKFTAGSDEVALGVLTSNIDHACIWILLSLFILFNIIYWSIYTQK